MRKLLFLPLALGLAAGVANAGLKNNHTVYIDTVNRNAQGDLGATRNSADANEYIYCSTFSTSSGGQNGYCTARDTKGNFLGCNTNDPNVIKVVASLDGDGAIYFNVDTQGICTLVWAQKSSYFAPKNP